MNRKSRVAVTKNLILQVQKNIEKNIPLKKIAEILLISYPTVRSIAKKISTIENYAENFKSAYENRKSPRRLVSYASIIREMIDSNNNISQKEIQEELEAIGIRISQATISRTIKSLEYSRKRLTIVPIERNTPTNIESRRIYARMITELKDENLFFLDECGFNSHTNNHYGYSPVNTKAIKFLRAGKGQNVSLLCMISIDGLLSFTIHKGSINTLILKNFLNNELVESSFGLNQKYLIMDNVRFHHSNEIKEVCQRKSISLKYLPTYSPQLNPIEEFFSVVKSRYNRIHSPKNTFDQIKSCIEEAIESVEPIIFIKIYNNMRRWIEKALAGEMFL